MTSNGRWRTYQPVEPVHAMRIQDLSDVTIATDTGAPIRATHHGWRLRYRNGFLEARWGDWLLRGKDGQFWPVSERNFLDSYRRDNGGQ